MALKTNLNFKRNWSLNNLYVVMYRIYGAVVSTKQVVDELQTKNGMSDNMLVELIKVLSDTLYSIGDETNVKDLILNFENHERVVCLKQIKYGITN